MIVTDKQISSSPKGCDCVFVNMGDAGLKIYKKKKYRDRQFRLQQKFHKIGLAPACWFPFDFDGPDGEMVYAFYSEIAEVRNSSYDESWGEYEDAGESLADHLYNYFGINWTDNHGGNVGKISGEYVIIDFGYFMDCDGNTIKE